MKAITIQLTDRAYNIIRKALEEADAPCTVSEFLEEEINENAEAMVDAVHGY
jgi:hypothetical protein